MDAPRKTTPFGKYELIEKVASGGMAEVFRACTRGEAGFEKELAIKRILPHLSRDSEFVVMLIDEAKIAVTLNHANVVQIYDLGKVEGNYFIAMEFVEGADLKAVLLRALSMGRPIPPALAVFITIEVLKGLEYAHQKKVVSKDTPYDLRIIHRDISPPNILLSYEGEVKLVDFGIAKANTRMMETSAGVLKGKFEYMSPEQAAGLELDSRTDLFSAGLCLYEAMTGLNPFTAPTELQVIQKVRSARFMPASALNPDVPKRIDQVLARALAREKDERYQSATEFRSDLAHAAYETGLVATSPKLAAFMRELFSEEMAGGRSFVSGAVLEAELERKNPAPRAASDPEEAEEDDLGPHTVIRQSPFTGRDAPEAAAPARAAPVRHLSPEVMRPAAEAPRVASLLDASSDATFLAPSTKPGPQRLADVSSDATFLAPQRPTPPTTPPPAAATPPRTRLPGDLKAPSRPAESRSQAPARPPQPPPAARPPQTQAALVPPAKVPAAAPGRRADPDAQPTFFNRPAGGAVSLLKDDPHEDGTDSIETRRGMTAPREEAATDPNVRQRREAEAAAERGPETITAMRSEPFVAPEPLRPPARPGAAELATVPTVDVPRRPAATETRDIPAARPPFAAGPQMEMDDDLALDDGDGTLQPPVWGHPQAPVPSAQERTERPPVERVAPAPQAPAPSAGAQVRYAWRTHVAAFTLGVAFGLMGVVAAVSFTQHETPTPVIDAPPMVAEIVIRAVNGAVTSVDGKQVGDTYPLTVALPPSEAHDVEVRMEGYEPFKQSVTLTPGATRVVDISFHRIGTSADGAPATAP